MQALETERDEFYTVWRLIAERGLFPQSLQAFGLISKMHREILRECTASSCFWMKLRRNAERFAELEFDDQEWINFQTMRRSPILEIPDASRPERKLPLHCSMAFAGPLNMRTQHTHRSDKVTLSGEASGSGVLDSANPEIFRGKRSTNRENDSVLDEKGQRNAQAKTNDASQAESGTRRFLRLCYFPVLWMHEYKRVVLFLNVPQKFQESEEQLYQRMTEMVLKYGRVNLCSCAFHSSIHDLIWSVEAGRKKRVLSRKNYWVPGSPTKETSSKLPWFKYQTIIGVCKSEDDAETLVARKAQFRKAASIYLIRCASSGDLDRVLRKANEHKSSESSEDTDKL